MYFIHMWTIQGTFSAQEVSETPPSLSLCSPLPSPRLRLLWEEGMYEWTALHAHARVCTHSHTHRCPRLLRLVHSQISGRACHLTLSKQRKPAKIELLTRYGNAFKSCCTYQYTTAQIWSLYTSDTVVHYQGQERKTLFKIEMLTDFHDLPNSVLWLQTCW